MPFHTKPLHNHHLIISTCALGKTCSGKGTCFSCEYYENSTFATASPQQNCLSFFVWGQCRCRSMLLGIGSFPEVLQTLGDNAKVPAQPFCDGPMEERSDDWFRIQRGYLDFDRNEEYFLNGERYRPSHSRNKLISSLTSFASCKIPSMISSHFPSKVKTFHSGWNCNPKCC